MSSNNEGVPQPPRKRRRLNGPDEDPDQALDKCVRRNLLCSICFRLPSPKKAFQCHYDHVICEYCAMRLLAHAKLAGQLAECPRCRTHFNWQGLRHFISVEQIIGELNQRCADCNCQMTYSNLEVHVKIDCPKRLVVCKYRNLGCIWQCSFDVMAEHEAQCDFPNMNAYQLVEALRNFEARELLNFREELLGFRELNAARINYLDFDLKIVNSQLVGENAVFNLQSPTLEMYNEAWQLNMHLQDSANVELGFTYSLMIMEAPQRPTHVKYFIGLLSKGLSGQQLSDTKNQINEATYSYAYQMDAIKAFPICCPSANYALLAMPVIKLRLWMMKQLN